MEPAATRERLRTSFTIAEVADAARHRRRSGGSPCFAGCGGGGGTEEAEVGCLAEAVYHEARGTPEASQEAVAHVVVNRSDHEDFPDGVCAVLEDRCQFSYECDGKPETMTEPEARAEAVETAEQVLDGAAPDPTGGALYYHNGAVTPHWADDFQPTTELGGHTFYR